ncbi:MAG TPA: mechanosensitive ion channel protein MscS [Planctomycetes bacterium]|nr:mechanosensitive ion channel protein MscS [Planctomycetota bacterium]
MRLAILAFLVCVCGWAAEPVPAQTDFEPLEAAPVVLWNRTVAELRVGIEDLSVAERVARIQRRVGALSDDQLAQPIRLRPATIDGVSGHMLYAGPELVMALADGDVADGQVPAVVAQAVADRLRQAFDARLAQHRPDVLLWGIVWTVVATCVLLIALLFVMRGYRAVAGRITALPLSLPRLAGIDPVPAVRGLLRLLVRGGVWTVVGVLLYAWLATVLSQFPYTRPLAEVLGNHLLSFGRFLLAALLGALPGLGMVLVIIILTRIAARALEAFFASVENGSIEISWMEPDTAKATRRIAGIVLWLFALTVAYPYIPGSSSDAFKGVSVFAGLLLTLGSAGMVNQMMSGLVVVYSRMMKPGDMVKVGEVTGQVTELGFLSTKVRTPTGHEITLPNAILTGTSVSNFSRFDKATGPVVSTTVTIGYDTPWRQVHALLALAASRTPGVVRDAKPEIVQTALSDFYVEYQLRCRIEQVEARLGVLSDLHAQVQDAFNEFGVQIMSPHFNSQPAQNVLVPPGGQAPPPAAAT